MDKRARSEVGGFPDVAKAVKLFFRNKWREWSRKEVRQQWRLS
jgi:hypothetical protein